MNEEVNPIAEKVMVEVKPARTERSVKGDERVISVIAMVNLVIPMVLSVISSINVFVHTT